MKRICRALRAVLAAVLILCLLSSSAFAARPESEPAETDPKPTAPATFTPYATVSSSVEQYTPLIRYYTSAFAMSGYTELVKAIMMQESKGSGSDPMQASECGSNLLFPRQPNGITDPEYSIEIGVYTFCTALRLAGAAGPSDYQGIALALQGYNYGAAYITWALENYGGYTKLNAVEYSELMCEQMGWPSYGDRNYVSHVLQWYCFPTKITDSPNQLIVEVARDQIGSAEWASGVETEDDIRRADAAALFITRCAERSGCFQFGTMPEADSCEESREWFIKHKLWKDADHTPKPGDILFLDRDGDGAADFAAIVDHAENGVIHTVEPDRSTWICLTNRYEIGKAPILGFGSPVY